MTVGTVKSEGLHVQPENGEETKQKDSGKVFQSFVVAESAATNGGMEGMRDMQKAIASRKEAVVVG